MAHDQALLNSSDVIFKAWEELGHITGRHYAAVETYKVEEADTLIFGMGSICETASMAVDRMREKGKKVGLVKLRLWRPLPVEDLEKNPGPGQRCRGPGSIACPLGPRTLR